MPPLPPPPNKRADRVDAQALKVKAARPSESGKRKSVSSKASVHKEPAKSPSAVVKASENLKLSAPSAEPVKSKTSVAVSQAYPTTDTPQASVALKNAKQKVKKGKTPAHGKRASMQNKLFILDTNVLMHDPVSLFRFEEHDLFISLVTLEELDAHKKGTTEVARNTRQASRYLDELVEGLEQVDIATGIPLNRTGHPEAAGKLFFQTQPLNTALPVSLPQGKADNQILGVVHALSMQNPLRQVVLVSKDINMRIKARALGLFAEDYTNDKTLDDGDLLYSGVLELPADFWDEHGKTMESWKQGEFTFYRISGPIVPALYINQFVYYEAAGATPLYARVTEIRGNTAVLKTLKDYTHAKNSVWGIHARNREQNFALNALMDPDIDFVTLTGQAGTGKTLITLAAGLTQVLDERRYSEIIMTRVTVSVGEDIGFLPGTEEEKMGPWMGALDDNLEVLSKSENSTGEWGRAATNDLVRNKIKIKSLNFMRGRTFLNKYLIIDEAQNLTPKQMKTLITRAGPGTKIICMGNLAQIDTPYLTEGSSGLTYVVDRFKGWGHYGQVMLARGERSRLADFASEIL